MQNPYIVHEDTPYTIKKFVTGTPLADEMARVTPDEHGVYPISPLGFLDGDTSRPARITAVSRPSQEYTEDTEPFAGLYSAGLVFTVDSVPPLTPREYPAFSVTRVSRTDAGYEIVADGDIRDAREKFPSLTLFLANASEQNDYSSLGIVGTDFTVYVDDAVSYDPVSGKTTVTIPAQDGWRLTGTVAEGRLVLYVRPIGWERPLSGTKYLYCLDTHDVYALYAGGRVSLRMHVGEYLQGGCPDVEPGRNAYSDREVMDWVENRVGGVMSSGVHPSSTSGQLVGAGSLTRWFTSGGSVDIGTEGKPVYVEGFGLGAGYFGDSAGAESVTPPRVRTDDPTSAGPTETEHPVITFGYGTSSGALSDVGISALPHDWPFGQAGNHENNNITLVGSPVTVAGRQIGGITGATAYRACPACSGAGYVDGERCAECDGTGVGEGHRFDANRVHVCLYNDFTPKGESDTVYDKDSTVVKKTFLHLGAPLDTKDGAEYEVTVSLPNISTADAFNTGDRVKDLGAYYAYVSQPRVYVLSGTWKFSSDPVRVTDVSVSGTGFTVKCDNAFSAGGEPLPDGTSVRFTVTSTRMRPARAEYIGVLGAGGTEISVDGQFAYDVGGRGWVNDLKICGLAYLDAPGDEPNNPSDTSLGLVSRTDETVNLVDRGEGESGSLDAYNRFYSMDGGEGKTELGGPADHRYIVATVYPTTTSTFPWAIAGRRKLTMCDRILTDEVVRDGSVADIAWEMNRRIVAMDAVPMPLPETASNEIRKGIFGWSGDGRREGFGPGAVKGTLMPVSYASEHAGASFKFIRSLRVALPPTLSESAEYNRKFSGTNYDLTDSARTAVGEMVDDFFRLRLAYSVTGRTGTVRIPANVDPSGFEWNTSMFGEFGEGDLSDSTSVTWLARMRHVPRYVYGSVDDTTIPDELKSHNRLYPFAQADNVRSLYSEVNAIYSGDLESTGDRDESPCGIDADSARPAVFADRSVVRDALRVRDGIAGKVYYSDVLREIEAQCAELDPEKLAHPYRYRFGGTAKSGLDELMDAYTKVLSVDGIPPLGGTVTVSDILDALSDSQLAYVGGDAFAAYRAESGEDFDFLSSTVPTATPLAELLRNYVPMYASRVPTRCWNSGRVYVPEGGIESPATPAGKRVYCTRIKWLADAIAREGCDDGAMMRIANDTFITCGTDTEPEDSNLNWVSPDSSEGDILFEGNYSVPPGTSTVRYTGWPGSGTTITRIRRHTSGCT